VGTIAALQNFGVIRGIGQTDTMTIAVNGTDDAPLIAGFDTDDSVSGMELISGLELTGEDD
jgi:VCBS repeat-containing protein